MFNIKSKSVKEPDKEPEKTTFLKIYFKDNTYIRYWANNGLDDGIEGHWRGFLKWFHCREQSEIYALKATNMRTAFKREDIVRYSIYVGIPPLPED